MLISGTETSHAPTHTPAVPVTTVTEDEQSVRQQNLNPTGNTAASEGPTMNFRNVSAMDRATINSQRRGNLVLFVKSNDNESDGPPRAINNTSMLSQSHNGGSGNSSVASQSGAQKDDGEEGEEDDITSLVVSAFSNGGSSVLKAVFGVTHKPLLTAAIVLLYFILLDIVLLQDNERLNRVLRRVRAADNEALVLMSSSLVWQMQEAKKDLRNALALRDPPATLERLEVLQHEALALERVCNRSLARLHLQLMFPGTVEDLTFLVEEHVAFDSQLQHLVGEELDWMRTVTSSSVVHMSGGAPEMEGFLLTSDAAALGTARSSDNGHTDHGPGMFKRKEDADTAAVQSSSLRNVRLERVKKPVKGNNKGSGAGPQRLSAPAGERMTQTIAATERRRLHLQSKNVPSEKEVEDIMEEGVAASGLLNLLKNRVIAFVIICLLLAAVLRMG